MKTRFADCNPVPVLPSLPPVSGVPRLHEDAEGRCVIHSCGEPFAGGDIQQGTHVLVDLRSCDLENMLAKGVRKEQVTQSYISEEDYMNMSMNMKHEYIDVIP